MKMVIAKAITMAVSTKACGSGSATAEASAAVPKGSVRWWVPPALISTRFPA